MLSDRRRAHPRRARLRLHQRIPRRRQFDRDGRVDARAVAGQGGHLGGVLQFRRRVHLRHRRSPSTVGSGMIDIKIVTFAVIFGGLIGAIVWDLITWYFGLPTSSSHALDRRLRRRRRRQGRLRGDHLRRLDQDDHLHLPVAAHRPGRSASRIMIVDPLDLPLDAAVARRSLVPPAAAAVGGVLQPEPRRQRRAEDDGDHRRRAVRRAATSIRFYIPFWVVLAAHAAIGLGTLAGGWRIIHTMGSKITKLQPVGGFAAETGAAIALLTATQTRRAGQHDARDHRRDRRRRRDAAAVGGALGRRRPDRLGVGADDSRGVLHRGGRLTRCCASPARSRPRRSTQTRTQERGSGSNFRGSASAVSICVLR